MSINNEVDTDSDFFYMSQEHRDLCEELQKKVKELLLVKEWDSDDSLMIAAAEALGNKDERFCCIYICEQCGRVYHSDYSGNQDPDHDFCDSECEYSFLGHYYGEESEGE
jgi:hypothetical protein